ncbi:unnamed protein product [Didymodactylos carnosus]|uniref:Ubiquitin-like domain-containing protein n=1 Tax=Didymodactylos carnosus TaxID=1234261 RepID=A0A815Y067_9BILA|nr:unnamed protein product [Didymodactylos carnosus]CAF1564926.1 unnamed protein product [Didymodactylos carnosus]CAF3840776.1 unnamed protein product [Didymodactylos carnosus]CAF4426939.1 unnamed protein product [Didymodactylos carnosus]
MTAANLPPITWHIGDYEIESLCSAKDKYSIERLFSAVESHDVTVVKTFTNEQLRNLCRIRRLFHSEWSAPAEEKQTAYQRACFLGYTDIVQCMLEAGIRVDQEFTPVFHGVSASGGTRDIQRSAFMFACHSGSVTTIRALLQAVSSDYAEHYKCRNRIATCSSSFAKQYLIPQGSWVEESLNKCSLDQSSSIANSFELVFPIHFAIAQDNLEMARQIVTSSNNELDTHNSWKPVQHGGFTPLHIACLFNRSVAMVELLLSLGEGGGNPLLQTSNEGMFADQMASDRTLIKYLRPKRFCLTAAMERERLNDLEEMQSGKPYEIFIRPLSGQTLTLTVTGHTTTAELGAYFQNECGIPLERQKLLFKGQPIPTCGEILPLVHYSIKKDSVLGIIWRNPK